MVIEYNGVTYPDLPADTLASYSYVVAFTSEDIVLALCSAGPLYGIMMEDSVIAYATGLPGSDISGFGDPGWTLLGYGDSETWVLMGSSSDEPFLTGYGNPSVSVELVSTMFYANHDVMVATSEDGETVAFTDQILFARTDTNGGEDTGDTGDSGGSNDSGDSDNTNDSSTYESAYWMPFSWYVDIADHARRLSGRNEKMTPEGIDYAFSSVLPAISALPNAENYAFGSSSVEYGMNADPSVFTNSFNADITWSNLIEVKTDIKVVGFRALGSANGTRSVYLYDVNGNLLSTTTVKTNGQNGEWGEVLLDVPIRLSAGNQYHVCIYEAYNLHAATSSKVSFNTKIQYIKYGYVSGQGFPTRSSTGYVIPVDIILGAESADLPDTYQISVDTLNNLAIAIQNVTGVSNAMTPTEMISTLGST